MLKPLFRKTVRRIGIPMPFAGVICPELTQTFYIESDWRARIHTRRSLVFTESPQPGDLSERYPIEPGSPLEVLFYDSPDAVEVGRQRRDARTLMVDWQPRTPVLRYALYHHDDTWIAPPVQKKSAISAEWRCDMKTGTASLEFITPGQFEAGIVFRRPRWRHFRTERGLIKYALSSMKREHAHHARLDEGGKRAAFQNDGPKVGERFVFVLFHEHGMADWERRIEESSLRGRARRLVGGLTHAFGR